MASGTEALITLQADIEDLVPAEASPRLGETAGGSFPKVLRRRLEKFFSEENISPKADGMMWTKIAAGLIVLAGSWIALYTLKTNAWLFVALYLLSGLAQTFLLLNIAHDSNRLSLNRWHHNLAQQNEERFSGCLHWLTCRVQCRCR